MREKKPSLIKKKEHAWFLLSVTIIRYTVQLYKINKSIRFANFYGFIKKILKTCKLF